MDLGDFSKARRADHPQLTRNTESFKKWGLRRPLKGETQWSYTLLPCAGDLGMAFVHSTVIQSWNAAAFEVQRMRLVRYGSNLDARGLLVRIVDRAT